MDIEQIIALATYLDENGAHEEADKLDAILREAAGTDPREEEYMEFFFGRQDAPPLKVERPPKDPTQPSFQDVLQGVVADYLQRNPGTEMEVGSACGGMSRDIFAQLDKGDKADDMALDDFGKNPFGESQEDSIGLVEQVAKQLDLPGNLVDAIKRHLEEKAVEKSPDEVEPSADMTEAFSRLSSIADRLDSMGHHKEADVLDEFISKYAEEVGSNDVMDWKEEGDTEQSKRYDAQHHHDLLVRKNKGEDERVDREGYKDQSHVHTYQKPGASKKEAALSTRYSPELIGVPLARIGEDQWQCPVTGKVYNFATGYTDMNGEFQPGGSVAAQTPSSSEYETPHRMFDSRENILNRIN